MEDASKEKDPARIRRRLRLVFALTIYAGIGWKFGVGIATDSVGWGIVVLIGCGLFFLVIGSLLMIIGGGLAPLLPVSGGDTVPQRRSPLESALCSDPMSRKLGTMPPPSSFFPPLTTAGSSNGPWLERTDRRPGVERRPTPGGRTMASAPEFVSTTWPTCVRVSSSVDCHNPAKVPFKRRFFLWNPTV